MRALATIATGLLLAACATSPLDTSAVNSRATPSQVVEGAIAHRGERVQWGGSIVSVVNGDRTTDIEVLSYPVARDGFPNTYRKPTGRFVFRYGGFLEPQDYSPGRLVTVVGTVDSMVTTSVGDARLVVPRLDAEQLKLWSRKYEASQPRIGFGVGISVGF